MDTVREIKEMIDYINYNVNNLRASLITLREAAKGNLPECSNELKLAKKVIGKLINFRLELEEIIDGN